jgi:hypothetical protein
MYKQRRTPPTNQRLLPTRTARTGTTAWDHNWLAHVQLRDPYYEANYFHNPPYNGLPPGYKAYQNWEAVVFFPGGGSTVLRGGTNQGPDVVLEESRSKVRLEFLGSIMYDNRPARGAVYHPDNYPQFATNGVRLIYPDGSQEFYSMVVKSSDTGSMEQPPGGSSALTTRAEALLTHRFSPDGRRSVVAYEAPGQFGSYVPPYCVRAKQVIDPDG